MEILLTILFIGKDKIATQTIQANSIKECKRIGEEYKSNFDTDSSVFTVGSIIVRYSCIKQ